MAFKPSSAYKHDGQLLHPKLTYDLPPGMQAFLISSGLGAAVEGPADVDFSHLSWDTGTTLYQGGSVAPAPISHEMR